MNDAEDTKINSIVGIKNDAYLSQEMVGIDLFTFAVVNLQTD